MSDTKYKSKRFLLPILFLVLVSIISVASISAYITVSVYKADMYEQIEKTKKEYTQKHKNRIYKDVHFVNESIKFEITKIENILKEDLKEKVVLALDIAQNIYDKYKDKLNEEQIKRKIASTLNIMKFYDNRGYYFMYDFKTKLMYAHKIEKFISKDMTNFEDVRGQNLAKLNANAIKDKKIGFHKIYFNKPDNQDEEFPKMVCVTKFEPLNMLIGIGEYLDVVEKKVQQNILERFSHINYKGDESYFFIMDMHNLNGGDNYATVLINSNKPEIEGKKISSKLKDIKGKLFREEVLSLAQNKGDGYLKYWYKKPSTQLPALKMSYIYFQKDWNWIIGSGFYYDNLEKQISIMKESIITHTNKTINKTLSWVLLLSLVAMLIAIFVSFKIDKTIKAYANRIIEFENNKRKQDNILMQQSKLASMGEMIGNIAHQWRQPLSVISMDANNIMLDVDLEEVNMQGLRKTAVDIVSQTEYLSKTIDDFRNFIMPNREKEEFDLKENIQNFIHLVEGSIKKYGINLELELEDNIKIYGYKNELVQCFMNIFNNAKDVLVEKNIENKFIYISTYIEEAKVVIIIKDNAGGIPKDIINKIFEPYFTTKHKSQGTGLGLHMTYNLIVEGMKGTIEAKNTKYIYKNEKYQGAEFIITLPYSIEKAF